MIWLVSRRFDLWMFLAPAVVALLLVPLGPWIAPTGETPLPMWIVCILLVDVAHVWSTVYRTYLDPDELARRRTLYVAAPIVAYLIGLALAATSIATFWTGLAYLAVFHFVRQQYGWVALYNRRDPKADRVDRIVDTVAIYAATLFPILWWHSRLPRGFHWFLPGDFVTGLVPPLLIDLLWPVYVLSLLAFAVRQLSRRRWGKIIVVVTTALCWGIGIIATNTDWAFTVTNVLIHGVPYMGLVWVYGARKRHRGSPFLRWLFSGRHVLVFLGLLAGVAYVEELGWDRLLWHSDHGLFVGPAVRPSEGLLIWLIPLLALPQITHYLLDGFIWRTAKEQALTKNFGLVSNRPLPERR